MASGSAMQQDSLLVSLGGDGTSELLLLAYFAFGVKNQAKQQLMAGELAPEGSQHGHTFVMAELVNGAVFRGAFWSWHLRGVIQRRLQEPVSALSALVSLSISRLFWAPGRG
jgi:hypothetical protein